MSQPETGAFCAADQTGDSSVGTVPPPVISSAILETPIATSQAAEQANEGAAAVVAQCGPPPTAANEMPPSAAQVQDNPAPAPAVNQSETGGSQTADQAVGASVGDITRPGISVATLKAAGIVKGPTGLQIHYHGIDGKPTCFYRIRLETPRGDQKYHQAAGSGTRAYIPPQLGTMRPHGDLVIVEGEFKALSLVDAGIPAIGLPSFIPYQNVGGSTKLTEGIEAAINLRHPERILFLGDSDTSTNYMFAHAVVELAKLLPSYKIVLPRIPLNGPGKGIDDCREALGQGFEEFWAGIVANAETYKSKTSPSALALRLLKREEQAIQEATQVDRDLYSERVVRMAAECPDPLVVGKLREFATSAFGCTKGDFDQAVKKQAKAKDANRRREGQKLAKAAKKDFEAYYDAGRKDYWIRNSRGGWVEVYESQLRPHLKMAGYSPEQAEGQSLSPLDQYLVHAQVDRDVAFAGPLAGYKTGIYDMLGQRVLVSASPVLVEPKAGECRTIMLVLRCLLGEEQLPYFLYWLKVSVEALQSGNFRPGQALVIAGPRGCGKSLVQNKIITPLLGGRSAKAYRYMSEATEFNGDLFGAEHLMIEDDVASTDMRRRRALGARIKEITVNETASCHAKHRQAITLRPFWRLSITCNDEDEALMVLPPIDESLADKIILLKANKVPLPWPTETTEERAKFAATLAAELPAFAHFLLHQSIPTNYSSQRFGVKHYHHPELLAAIDAMAPETRLLELIDSTLFPACNTRQYWEGSATQLQTELLAGSNRAIAQGLLGWSNATGTYLGKLRQKHPTRVHKSDDREQRGWLILRSGTRLEDLVPFGL